MPENILAGSCIIRCGSDDFDMGDWLLFTNALMMPELMLHVIYRAARYCHAAAHGGQITAPYSLVHQVVRVWTGDPKMTAADADMGSEPRRVQVQ